jgi:hypothetical protein
MIVQQLMSPYVNEMSCIGHDTRQDAVKSSGVHGGDKTVPFFREHSRPYIAAGEDLVRGQSAEDEL